MDRRMTYRMNSVQLRALINVHRNFKVPFDVDKADELFRPTFDLPDDWVAGWVGDKIYVGVSPEGEVNS